MAASHIGCSRQSDIASPALAQWVPEAKIDRCRQENLDAWS
jgi:hypothetical protein